MAIQNQSPKTSSIESMLAILDETEASGMTPEYVDESSYNDDSVKGIDSSIVEEPKASPDKTAKRKKTSSVPVTDFSAEFERCLQEFKGKQAQRFDVRVPVDIDIAETLRLIKGHDLKTVVNAALKTMLLLHKDEIRKYFAPKPKYIV